MTINMIDSHVNERGHCVRTSFTMYGRTFHVECSTDIPKEHLQGYIKQHISNLVWNEVFERPITELATMIACENLKRRDDVLKRVGGGE